MSWLTGVLTDLGTVERGRSRHRPRNDPALFGGHYPFFQTGDVKAAGLWLTEYGDTYNEQGLAQSRLWPRGTLCITIAANIAEAAVLAQPGCFPDSVVGFTPHLDRSDVVFVKYLLDHIRHRFQAISRGTTQDNLSLDKLISVRFKYPPLVTQRKIAAILSAYDELIERNNLRIRLLEEMARRIYREWFIEYRYPGHETVALAESELGSIPCGWDVLTLGEVCEVMQAGGTPSRANAAFWADGTVDWYTTTELQDGFLFGSTQRVTAVAVEARKTRVFNEGTLLMAIYGSPTVGRMGILTRPGACNQAALAMRANPDYLPQVLLYYTLLDLRGHFNSIAQGAAQQNISKEKVAKTRVLCPAREISTRASELLEPTWQQMRVFAEAVARLRATRDVLLPRLISGEIEVDDLNIEVPAAA